MRTLWVRGTSFKLSALRGQWDDALRACTTLLTGGEGMRQIGFEAAIIAMRQDNIDLANHFLREAGIDDPHARVNRFSRRDSVAAVAVLAESAGDFHRAFDLRLSMFSDGFTFAWYDDGEFATDFVRLALELGRRDAAVSVAAAAAGVDTAEWRLIARSCQAVIDDDSETLLEVVAEYERRGWAPRQAFALEEAAVRLAREGRAQDARGALLKAAQIYLDLAAVMDLRRADARLRQYKVRRGPHSLHRRASSGWEALTPAEIRVAQLVAQGLSNPDIASRLYISRQTVQTHVSNILGKLGKDSRVEVILELGNNTATAITSSR